MKNIFNISSDAAFREQCLAVFRYQYKHVEIYRRFCDYLHTDPMKMDSIEKIPFLPIEMFKNHQVLDEKFSPKHFFQSSGTTQTVRSRHYIADFDLYEQSIGKSFSQFIGPPEDYVFLGLLPNYSENPHASLIYMVDFLMKKSGKPENGYYLYNHGELRDLLASLRHQKVLLFGVSFALLDFLDYCTENHVELPQNPQLTIIETGGMKGRKEEMTKDQLLGMLQKGFRSERIFSEYSMTELLSQAYSTGENIYYSPHWMRILIRNTEDPFAYMPAGRTGAINIIDLANLHSCAFIATQDLGILHQTDLAHSIHPAFSVVGRIDHSDIRGCSLLVS